MSKYNSDSIEYSAAARTRLEALVSKAHKKHGWYPSMHYAKDPGGMQETLAKVISAHLLGVIKETVPQSVWAEISPNLTQSLQELVPVSESNDNEQIDSTPNAFRR